MTLLFSLIQRCFSPLWQIFQSALRLWTKPDNRSLPLNAVLDLNRTKPELILENALLRQQIIILERQFKRPRLSWRDRTIIVLLTSRLRTWKAALKIVQPDTVLRWHRDLFRWVWARKSQPKGKPGRPPLDKDIVALIKQIARHR